MRASPVWLNILCLSLAASTAHAAITPYAPHSTVAGQTIGQWSAAWWNWEASFSSPNDPVTDATGAIAAQHQSGPVFFLAGFAGTAATLTRTFSVPPNDNLLLALPAILVVNGPDSGYPDTKTEANEVMTGVTASPASMFLTVDGIAIPNLTSYREVSPINFTFTAAANNPLGQPVGVATDANSDGFFIMLPPLTPGTHALHYGFTTVPFDFFPTLTDNQTANITVTPEPASWTLLLVGASAYLMPKRRRSQP